MNEAAAVIHWKAFDRSRQRFDKRIQAAVIAALDKQFAPIIAAVEAGSDNPEGRAATYPIEKLFEYIYGTVGVEFARQSYLSTKGLPSDFLIKDRTSDATELEGNWLRLMRRIAQTQAGEKIKGITQTTKDIVRRVMGQGQDEGLSVPDIAKRLREKWSQLTKSRAVVIARTEIISSSNAGSLLGAQSTGLQLQKSWLATRDSRTRSSHAHVDGQSVDLDGVFTVNGDKLRYPGDSSLGAKPATTIQCRCTIVYKRKEE